MCCVLPAFLRVECGLSVVSVLVRGEISFHFRGSTLVCLYIMYARGMVVKAPCRRMNLRVYLEVWVDFSYLCTRKRNERPCGDAGSLTLRDL